MQQKLKYGGNWLELLKEKYPSVHKYYTINITDDGKGTATRISRTHKTGEDPDKKAGIYFLRTTLDEKNEKPPLDDLQYYQGRGKHIQCIENRFGFTARLS